MIILLPVNIGFYHKYEHCLIFWNLSLSGPVTLTSVSASAWLFSFLIDRIYLNSLHWMYLSSLHELPIFRSAQGA